MGLYILTSCYSCPLFFFNKFEKHITFLTAIGASYIFSTTPFDAIVIWHEYQATSVM